MCRRTEEEVGPTVGLPTPSYDKNKRQIILLHLTRATGKFLKIVYVKTR